MALNSRKIRLPELPIFRKYSLALRQEFARAEDVLAALEESLEQIRAFTQEGARGLRPGIRPPRRSELRELSATEGSGSDDLGDESPESFLKDSVIHPSDRRTAARPGPAGETVAMTAVAGGDGGDKAVGTGRDRPSRSSPSSASAQRPQPGSPGDPRQSARRIKKSPARKPADSKPEAAVESKKTSRPAKRGPAQRKKTAGQKDSSQGEAARFAASNRPSGEEPDEDIQREFWGDERSWGKGRRGKPDKGRSGRVSIVRVGSEGRPVANAEPPAEGE